MFKRKIKMISMLLISAVSVSNVMQVVPTNTSIAFAQEMLTDDTTAQEYRVTVYLVGNNMQKSQIRNNSEIFDPEIEMQKVVNQYAELFEYDPNDYIIELYSDENCTIPATVVPIGNTSDIFIWAKITKKDNVTTESTTTIATTGKITENTTEKQEKQTTVKRPVISYLKNKAKQKMVIKLKAAKFKKCVIQVSTNKKFTKAKKYTLTKQKSTKVISGLKKQKYYVRAKIYVQSENKTIASKWSVVKQINIKK